MPKIKITTKMGDKGTSRLFSNEIVAKSDPRLEAYGDIDELVSLLGIVRAHMTDKKLKEEILSIQKDLFIVGSELATSEKKLSALPSRIDELKANELHQKTQKLNNELDIPNDFIVPGNNPVSAYLDYSRAVSRRCERKIVDLYNLQVISNEKMLVWMNRLSDYLYLLARLTDPKPTLLKK